MLSGYYAARVAVLALRWCKDAFGKAWSAQEHFANPRDFDNVYANGNDHN